MALSIIPAPDFVKLNDGFFMSSGLPQISGDAFFNNETENAQDLLYRAAAACGIQNGWTETASVCCHREKEAAGKPLGAEGYRMVVGADRIDLFAAERAGAHHAFETLRQLVLSGNEDGRLVIHRAEIIDAPRFAWRGFMLDTSRHFFPVPFIKKMLETLSLHHINVFHWHLTDDQGWRLVVPGYPKLIEIGSKRRRIQLRAEEWTGGFYTDEDIISIVRHAAALHIEVVPEADLPGHASAILASYPDFGCTGGPYQVEDRHGVFPDVLCAGNNEIFDFANVVFDTLCRLFPSPYIHIGGDEVPITRWAVCPRCKERVKELGLTGAKELQGWITSRFVAYLRNLGKTPIGWDEILDSNGIAYPLPAETVVMSWRGREGGINAAKAGHKVIMTPLSDGCYLDFRHQEGFDEPGQHFGITTLEKSYQSNPTAGIDEESAAKVLGGQGNLWTELIYADKLAEYMTFPRICALAEAFWSPLAAKDFNSFLRRMKAHQKRLDALDIMQFRRF